MSVNAVELRKFVPPPGAVTLNGHVNGETGYRVPLFSLESVNGSVPSVAEVVAHYQRFRHTNDPSLVTDTHQEVWDIRTTWKNGRKRDKILHPDGEELQVTVPQIPLDRHGIEQLAYYDWTVSFMPYRFSTAGDRELLADVLGLTVPQEIGIAGRNDIGVNKPKNLYGEEGRNSEDRNSGFWYAWQQTYDPYAIYTNKSAEDLASIFAKRSLSPTTLTLYLGMVGDMRDFERLLMDTTWTQFTYITGSTLYDKPLRAHWPTGRLRFYELLSADIQNSSLGGRPVMIFPSQNG